MLTRLKGRDRGVTGKGRRLTVIGVIAMAWFVGCAVDDTSGGAHNLAGQNQENR